MICLVTFVSGVGILTTTTVITVMAVGTTMTTAARLVTATTAPLTSGTIPSVSALSVQ